VPPDLSGACGPLSKVSAAAKPKVRFRPYASHPRLQQTLLQQVQQLPSIQAWAKHSNSPAAPPPWPQHTFWNGKKNPSGMPCAAGRLLSAEIRSWRTSWPPLLLRGLQLKPPLCNPKQLE